MSLPDDAVLAARVVGVIGEQPNPYRIRVRAGAVTFGRGTRWLQTRELVDSIARTEGVRIVRGVEPPY